MLAQITGRLAARATDLLPFAIAGALNVVAGLLILLVGVWLAGKTSGIVHRMIGRAPHIDAMLRGFFAALARYAVLTITGLAVLSKFGIQTTSIIAVLGAAGLAVGLALQGTLSNLAAGVMLLIFRPFAIGDKVQVGGAIGTVRDVSLIWTELAADDGVQIIVPNSGVWGQPLRIIGHFPTPPATGEARLRLGEGVDVEAALELARKIVAAQPAVAADPPPTVRLDRTAAENALEIVIGFAAPEADIPAIRGEIYRLARDLPTREARRESGTGADG
jgi:small conductance mechanosensitive channel